MVVIMVDMYNRCCTGVEGGFIYFGSYYRKMDTKIKFAGGNQSK
jgi:hypothetical protein